MSRALLLVPILFLLLPVAETRCESDFRARQSALIANEHVLDDIQAEIVFGRDVAARILGNYRRVGNAELNRYLNLVGTGVAAYCGRPELTFHFAVLDTKAVNAFAAPGGYIFITRGALALMEDESELAAVLAHEIGHVTARHIVQELNIKSSDRKGMVLAALVTGVTDPVRLALVQAVDEAVGILFNRGYKQQDELEADRIGTTVTAMAGYDPAALGRFVARIPPEGETGTDINRTHPPSPQRLANIDAVLVENGLTQSSANPIDKERFKRYVQID